MDEERLTIGVETCMITSSAEAPCGGRIGRRSERGRSDAENMQEIFLQQYCCFPA